jgi:predicted GNAT family acetyltransferase
MSWRLYRPSDRSELIKFLSKNEWGHVALSSRLRDPKSTFQNTYVRKSIGGEILGAVLLTTGGLLVPAFSEEILADIPELRPVLFRKSPQKKLHTVMGLRRGVEAVQRLLEAAPSASIVYHVMVLTKPREMEFPDDEIVCKRAKPRDASILYPLQKAYEIEEVLLDPGSFNPGVCFINLQKNLYREIVYYALIDGKPVAKAGTNARGFTIAQLGGVFTNEDVRNRGVAERLLSILLKELYSTATGASLFVKKENHAAIALYKKLGFVIKDEFKIAYYRL